MDNNIKEAKKIAFSQFRDLIISMVEQLRAAEAINQPTLNNTVKLAGDLTAIHSDSQKATDAAGNKVFKALKDGGMNKEDAENSAVELFKLARIEATEIYKHHQAVKANEAKKSHVSADRSVARTVKNILGGLLPKGNVERI